jgi:hypothetical protein
MSGPLTDGSEGRPLSEITVFYPAEPQQLRLQNAIDRFLFEMRSEGSVLSPAECGEPGKIRQFLSAAEHLGEPGPHRPAQLNMVG